MQVSTRISYPETGRARMRPSTPRPWTGDPVLPIRADERGSGYRGNLSRESQQQVNERLAGGSADMEVFVARSLSSTLAMLQMHVIPEAQAFVMSDTESHDASAAPTLSSFVDDLFSGVLVPRKAQ